MKTITIAGKTHPNRKGIKVGSATFVDQDEYANYMDATRATATAADIAIGKTAGVGKNLIAGTLNKFSSFQKVDLVPKWNNGTLHLSATVTPRAIFEDQATIDFAVIESRLGNADASVVLEGNTFTSKNGLAIPGTLKLGIDTSDATAEESNVESGKTYYAKGQKRTGNLSNAGNTAVALSNPTISVDSGSLRVIADNTVKRIVDTVTKMRTDIPLSKFGDALPADVRKGVVFTSSSGLKAVGTKEESAIPIYKRESSTGAMTAPARYRIAYNLDDLNACIAFHFRITPKSGGNFRNLYLFAMCKGNTNTASNWVVSATIENLDGTSEKINNVPLWMNETSNGILAYYDFTQGRLAELTAAEYSAERISFGV